MATGITAKDIMTIDPTKRVIPEPENKCWGPLMKTISEYKKDLDKREPDKHKDTNS